MRNVQYDQFVIAEEVSRNVIDIWEDRVLPRLRLDHYDTPKEEIDIDRWDLLDDSIESVERDLYNYGIKLPFSDFKKYYWIKTIRNGVLFYLYDSFLHPENETTDVDVLKNERIFQHFKLSRDTYRKEYIETMNENLERDGFGIIFDINKLEISSGKSYSSSVRKSRRANYYS